MDMTRALVLETHNVATDDRWIASFERLLGRLREDPAFAALDEVVVTTSGASPGAKRRCEKSAGRAIRWVELSDRASYYAAKNRGFEATTASLVAFGDSDCWPSAGWLDALFAPFASGAQCVAGRTTYREGSFGLAMTAIDFPYFRNVRDTRCVRNFYANNVAFRREVFERLRYDDRGDFFRGDCQLLGLRMRAEGVPIVFAEGAHTIHRLPDTVGETVRLRLFRGADTVLLAPHLVRAVVPWASTRPRRARAMAVLGARFVWTTGTIARSTRRGSRALAIPIAGLITGVDAAGALAHRAIRLRRSQLSYHDDVDQLS